MGFSARVLLDSVSPGGIRLTTMEVRYPRFVHAEVMTHRVFSRNAASSRSVPVRRMIDAVRADPAMPVWWGRNQSGMQARAEIDDAARAVAEAEWRAALADALAHAERLVAADVNLHKQLVNRLLEPFAWITVILTATEWTNFFAQRAHEDAQPELQHVATLMRDARDASSPEPVELGEWHTPLLADDERSSLPLDARLQISVARCARVSYLSHDGTRDHARDIELYERLLGGGANGHWSPFEHVATPLSDRDGWSGNFRGWEQFRKRFPQENVTAETALALQR
ncbi:MAG: FAD-dependent thymidylate synthase [Candidatus Eremiobacteraeota bacterium]|nr:FAD-dependent thymidylate synthase [Candidatus Eremiobacteraeota bacterium]